MNNRLLQLEQKRLIQEYSFVKADLAYKKSILEENQSQFLEKAYEMAGKERKTSEETHEESENARREKEKNDWKRFKPEIQEKAKKMYREISKKSHPDKDPSGAYADIFTGAALAYEDCQIFELYIYCDKLGITYEISNDEVIVMKDEIEKNKESLSKIETSFIYLWSIYDNEKMKEMIVRQFVRATKNQL
jgi:hypothetical protein